ncbi:MAG TPA: outer membrane beta-barrel protein [Steroidobacteraceae bacterium]
MKRFACAALCACALGGAAAAHADERRGGFLVDLDLAYGGDDLVTLSFEDGGTQDIKAGQGIGFALGGWYRPSQEMRLELQGALGFKYVTTAADNADISVSRTTLQLNAIYRFANDWYLGAGLVRHMGPKLDGDGWFEDIEFDDATGFNVQAGWRWIGLQVTRMDYSADGYEDADAGSVGLRFTWRPGS